MDPFLWLLVILFVLTGCTEFDPLLLRYENLPTCDMRGELFPARCREVRGQWGGAVDGRVWEQETDKGRINR